METQLIATVVSGLLTVLAGILAATAKARFARRYRSEDDAVAAQAKAGSSVDDALGALFRAAGYRAIGPEEPPAAAIPETITLSPEILGVDERLRETRQALLRQNRLANVHAVASWLLIVAQFIVGGLLASSFVQQLLSKETVGVLGVLVLASSLVRQHYKPEVENASARTRAGKLKAIIREVEDWSYLRSVDDPSAKSPATVRRMLTKVLQEVDEIDPQVTTSAANAPSAE